MPRPTVLLLASSDLGWTDLRLSIGCMHHLTIVGETSDLAQARALAQTKQPMFVIAADRIGLESTMPTLQDIKRDLSPGSNIVIFANRPDQTELAGFIDLGIIGYFVWQDLSSHTLQCTIANLVSGMMVIASRTAIPHLARGPESAAALGPAPPVTEFERQLLRQLAAGLTREEIAAQARISARTVKRRISDLEHKLDAPCMFVLGLRTAQLGLMHEAGPNGRPAAD
jgi:DNA-binding NarL/FixJ family response regulator